MPWNIMLIGCAAVTFSSPSTLMARAAYRAD
jgi:hypothetical protein